MILVVLLGGALGAVCRYGINVGMQVALGKLAFPWATFFINVLGSLVLSFLFFANYWGLPNTWRIAIGTGFLGAFTTFSTFELETLQMLESGKITLAVTYVLASVLMGLLAALLGRFLALRFG
jgi:fluoride exporter